MTEPWNFTETQRRQFREAQIAAVQRLATTFPLEIAVFCDRCGVEVRHDYVVHDLMTRDQRLAVAREHLTRNEGWSCTADGDYCPEHKPRGHGTRGGPVTKPKPPSPRSVSATLRTAGFRAIGDGDEGYEVGPFDGPGSGIVHVTFHSYLGDGSGAAVDAALAFEQEALASMMATLRHKGWAAEPSVPPAYLIVTEAGP